MTITVAAIVVTYNRKDLLRRCLSNLLTQTRPVDRIFIVDNASTDGTQEYLQTAGYFQNQTVEYVKLNHNGGGAGGFHEGMKRGFEAGFDWLWLMDDDGYPDPDCLKNQLNAQNTLDIIGAKVVQPENPNKLTWTLICYDQRGYLSPRKRIKTLEELIHHSEHNIYFGYGLFFNAILINRSAIERIGFVNEKLVIRGDEFEYFLRSRLAALKIGTQIQATYYHPFQAFHLNDWKFFYAFRNLFYNYTQFPTVTYPKPIRWLYLIYNFCKYLSQSPSFQWRYLFHLLKAVGLATQGKLLPYKLGGAPKPLS